MLRRQLYSKSDGLQQQENWKAVLPGCLSAAFRLPEEVIVPAFGPHPAKENHGSAEQVGAMFVTDRRRQHDAFGMSYLLMHGNEQSPTAGCMHWRDATCCEMREWP